MSGQGQNGQAGAYTPQGLGQQGLNTMRGAGFSSAPSWGGSQPQRGFETPQAQGFSAPNVLTQQGPGLQPPMSQRYGVPASPPPPMPMAQTQSPNAAALAAHMAQRNAITNGYVNPGEQATPFALQNHMQANANYTNGYGTPNAVPLPPWLQQPAASGGYSAPTTLQSPFGAPPVTRYGR